MKTVFVATDGEGATIAIVAADTREIAHAYFVGRGDIPVTMTAHDLEAEGLQGLLILYKTKKVRLGKLPHSTFDFVRVEDPR